MQHSRRRADVSSARLALVSGPVKRKLELKKVCKNKSFVGKRGVTQGAVSVFLLAFDEKLPYHFEFGATVAGALP